MPALSSRCHDTSWDDCNKLAQYAAEKRCMGVKFTTPQCDDLILWKMLLRQARDGISVNQLTYWKPTHIARSDACKHGHSGFSVSTGIVWQLEIPLEL
jgi:hypothetical protein